MKKTFTPGRPVFVIRRNEDLEPEEATGLLFIAEAGGFVIAAPFPYGYDTFEDMMEYFAETTREDFDTTLQVYPVADCFYELDEAVAAAGIE